MATDAAEMAGFGWRGMAWLKEALVQRSMLVLLAAIALTLTAATAMAQGYRGPTRVDFDERLIKGQTTKAGSVYIYDRQEIDIKSLVKRARSFKQRIIRTVFED